MYRRYGIGAHGTGPGWNDQTRKHHHQQGQAAEDPAFAMPLQRLVRSVAIERPMRATIIKMGVPTLRLTADRLEVNCVRDPFRFGHAPKFRCNKIVAYHNGTVRSASTPFRSSICNSFLVNIPITGRSLG